MFCDTLFLVEVSCRQLRQSRHGANGLHGDRRGGRRGERKGRGRRKREYGYVTWAADDT